MRAAGGEATGLRGGLPYRDGALDLLALWLKLYPGDVVQDLEKLNDYALRTRTTFRPVTKSEWVRFWGLVLAARQFNQKGKALWADHTEADGIREAPNFQKYMPHWRFEQIRALVKFSKAAPGAGPDTWQMFTQMVEDFNRNRMMMLGDGGVDHLRRGHERVPATLHQDWRSSQHILHQGQAQAELCVTAACTLRMAERSAPAGATVLGDSWFASGVTPEGQARRQSHGSPLHC
mmetsp:Transcript_24839/g.63963  ORF Transcript_24839/g.63963 Transcript_24839/m.63963 type:complete len:234 (-) Transcript_24839:193-894(-)